MDKKELIYCTIVSEYDDTYNLRLSKSQFKLLQWIAENNLLNGSFGKREAELDFSCDE